MFNHTVGLLVSRCLGRSVKYLSISKLQLDISRSVLHSVFWSFGLSTGWSFVSSYGWSFGQSVFGRLVKYLSISKFQLGTLVADGIVDISVK